MSSASEHLGRVESDDIRVILLLAVAMYAIVSVRAPTRIGMSRVVRRYGLARKHFRCHGRQLASSGRADAPLVLPVPATPIVDSVQYKDRRP